MRTLIFTIELEDDQDVPDVGDVGDWSNDKWEFLDVRLASVEDTPSDPS